jgi:hypothetical protein
MMHYLGQAGTYNQAACMLNQTYSFQADKAKQARSTTTYVHTNSFQMTTIPHTRLLEQPQQRISIQCQRGTT